MAPDPSPQNVRGSAWPENAAPFDRIASGPRNEVPCRMPDEEFHAYDGELASQDRPPAVVRSCRDARSIASRSSRKRCVSLPGERVQCAARAVGQPSVVEKI